MKLHPTPSGVQVIRKLKLSIPAPHNAKIPLHFWAWATGASKQADGTFQAQVKACYSAGWCAQRKTVVTMDGFASDKEARKWARGARQDMNRQHRGVVVS